MSALTMTPNTVIPQQTTYFIRLRAIPPLNHDELKRQIFAENIHLLPVTGQWETPENSTIALAACEAYATAICDPCLSVDKDGYILFTQVGNTITLVADPCYNIHTRVPPRRRQPLTIRAPPRAPTPEPTITLTAAELAREKEWAEDAEHARKRQFCPWMPLLSPGALAPQRERSKVLTPKERLFLPDIPPPTTTPPTPTTPVTNPSTTPSTPATTPPKIARYTPPHRRGRPALPTPLEVPLGIPLANRVAPIIKPTPTKPIKAGPFNLAPNWFSSTKGLWEKNKYAGTWPHNAAPPDPSKIPVPSFLRRKFGSPPLTPSLVAKDNFLKGTWMERNDGKGLKKVYGRYECRTSRYADFFEELERKEEEKKGWEGFKARDESGNPLDMPGWNLWMGGKK